MTLRPDTAQQIITDARIAYTLVSSDAEAVALAEQITRRVNRLRAQRWEPYPWQHPHLHPAGWVSQRAPGVCDERCYQLPAVPIPAQGAWLGYGGRGTGKTEQAARYVNEHAEGPACDPRLPGGHRIVIVAPTQPDAVDSCVTGPSGLQTINPDVKLVTTKEGTLVRWPNRARARVVGGHSPDDVERLRAAGNTCLVWVEEAAAIRRLQAVLDISAFGLRVGDHAHYVITSTPKNRPEMVEVKSRATVITKGRTRDATRLHAATRKAWEDRFGGTTLGRQELDAEELTDVEGALWVAKREPLVDGKPNRDDRPGIENTRVSPDEYGWRSHDPDAPLPHVRHLMQRVIVGVDPPGGRTEAGIVVNGAIGNHGYTLADLSIAAGPDTWARRAIQACIDYGSIGIALETAYGGDNVERVIESAAEGLGVLCPSIFRVPTKVGKKLRAEPIVALYQQSRWHHVGYFPELESEQTTWVEAETKESPNRLDAHVHAATWLLISARSSTAGSAAKRRIPGR